MKKKMRLVICVIMVFVMTFSFAACAGGDGGNDIDIQLKIMSWNFYTKEQDRINRRMVKAFEDANPGVKITIVEITEDYSNQLMGMAGRNEMPDVFMLDNLPLGLSNNWLLDITEYAEKDANWDKIPAPVEQAARFNGRVYAVPAEMHLNGLFVNDTVFNNANKNTLPVNPTYAQFKTALTQLNVTASIAALNNEESIHEWYPAVLNKDWGWFTFDSEKEKYNIDSDEYQSALTEMINIHNSGLSYDSWTVAQRQATGASDERDLFRKNGMAMMFAPSSYRNGLLYGDDEGDELLFQGDLRFVGLPGGRNIIIPDIYGISKATQNAEYAYKLAKWMSFGVEGILKRIELDSISKAAGKKSEFVSLPLSLDESVIEAYFENEEVAGLEEVFRTLDNGIVEGVKVIPGCITSRWDAVTNLSYTSTEGARSNAKIGDIIDDIRLGRAGDIDWAANKVQLNTLINQKYQNSVRALNEAYPKR